MKVLVEEENGYRMWIWKPPTNSSDELVEWWTKNMTSDFIDDFVFFDISGVMEGDWEEITSHEDPKLKDSYDAVAHIHESSDTSITIDEKIYYATEDGLP